MVEKIELLKSEDEALTKIKERLASFSRSPVLVVCGMYDVRLGLVLQVLAHMLGGKYLDGATPEVLADIKNGPPIYGRDQLGPLSDIALRQFLMRRASLQHVPVLAVRVPEVYWHIITNSGLDNLRRFLSGLGEWATPCGLVLSYPLGANPAISVGELANLLGRHLFEINLTESECRYLEGERKGVVHDEQ